MQSSKNVLREAFFWRKDDRGITHAKSFSPIPLAPIALILIVVMLKGTIYFMFHSDNLCTGQTLHRGVVHWHAHQGQF